jgi:SNF2 family DNA or RNA helicase
VRNIFTIFQADTDLLDKIAQFSSVVKKEDVLDLPERTFNIIDVILSPAEKTAYRDMINHLVAIIEDEEISAFNAAVKCMKLRQVTSGFLINENSEVRVFGKSKLNALVDLLEDIGNQQVIIWTQFVHEAEQIKTLLKDKSIGIINGSSKQADKDNWIKDFKAGDIQYLIAHPLSMAHGVTLTNCTYAIYYSLSYSHEEHVQSQDRIYRKGTTKPCTYYYLMAPGTIDTVIYNILQGKQKAELAVLDYVKHARDADKIWEDK